MTKFQNPFLNLIGVLTNLVLLTIGVTYWSDCPAEHMLPIYLIVAALLNLLLPPGVNRGQIYGDLGRPIFSLLKLAWTLAGRVWLRGLTSMNDDDPKNENYCYRPVYLTAQWLNSIAIGFVLYYGLLFILFLTYKPWQATTEIKINSCPKKTTDLPVQTSINQ